MVCFSTFLQSKQKKIWCRAYIQSGRWIRSGAVWIFTIYLRFRKKRIYQGLYVTGTGNRKFDNTWSSVWSCGKISRLWHQRVPIIFRWYMRPLVEKMRCMSLKVDSIKVVLALDSRPEATGLTTWKTGLINHQWTVFLFDPDTGIVKAIVGENPLTALRTLAASSVSIKDFACRNAKVIGVIGAGHQATFQLRAALKKHDFEKLLVGTVTSKCFPILKR